MTARISGYAFNAGGRPRAATITAEAIFDPGANPQPIGFFPSGDALIVSAVSTTADPQTGAWHLDLEPNGLLEPASSYYRFTVVVDGVDRSPVFAVVTADASLHDIATPTAPFIPDASASGRLIGYTRVLTDITLSSTTFADLAGLALAVTVGTRPFELEFYCSQVTASVGSKSSAFALFEGGAELAYGGCEHGLAGGTGVGVLLKHTFDVAPAPGLHTYKVQGGMGEAGGTRTLHAAPGFTIPVCSLRAIEN